MPAKKNNLLFPAARAPVESLRMLVSLPKVSHGVKRWAALTARSGQPLEAAVEAQYSSCSRTTSTVSDENPMVESLRSVP